MGSLTLWPSWWLFWRQSQHFFGQSFDFSTSFDNFLVNFLANFLYSFLYSFLYIFLYNFLYNFFGNFGQFLELFLWTCFFFKSILIWQASTFNQVFLLGLNWNYIWNIPNNLQGTLVTAAATSPPVDRDPRDDKVSSRSNNITIRLLSRG